MKTYPMLLHLISPHVLHPRLMCPHLLHLHLMCSNLLCLHLTCPHQMWAPPNMSPLSEPVFTVPSCHALTLMSVPTNSGSSSWQQAFHNTHCSTLSQVVLTSPRLLHPTTVITGLWHVSQPR